MHNKLRKGVGFLCLLLSMLTIAEPINLNGQCSQKGQQWYVSLTATIHLAIEPVQALQSGIPLYFVYELKNKETWQRQQIAVRVLSYNPITFSYQVEDGVQTRSFLNLATALVAVGNVSQQVLPVSKPTEVQLRLRLQTEQLPFSLRLPTMLAQQWQIQSGWWTCPRV